jgi:hypothetical protein
VSMHMSYPIKVEWVTTGVSSLILRHYLPLIQNSPTLSTVPQKKLHCKSKRLVQAYNAELDMLCNHHKMYQKIYFIYTNLDSFSDEDFLYLMNNWHKELVQFKLQSKVNCTKFKTCHIEWSPEVGFWLSRPWLLACVKVYVMGLGPPGPCKLIRD